VHADVLAMREESARRGQRLDQVDAEVRTVARSQITHGAALAEMAGKVDGLDRRLNGLEQKVDGLGRKADSQGETLAGHGEMLRSYGEMLTEILRRLPASPG
jgi:hypothetical protein